MKRTFLVISLILFSIITFPQKKLLIDCVHGADYYYGFYYDAPEGPPIPIDFEELFPEYEITIIGKDSVPFGELLIDEIQPGNQNLEYEIDLPDYILPVALYVTVSADTDSLFDYITGSISNPNGEIVAEMFNGIIHYDGASGFGWTVNINLGNLENYSVKIGPGSMLFDQGNIQLTDYNIVLRIKDNTWYAINGFSPDYSSYDLQEFTIAFDDGLTFLNVYNMYESMVEKPFVHFNSNIELEVDFRVNIPGNAKYYAPEPVRTGNELKWKDHSLDKNQQNEIVYEAIFDNKLNFVHFDIDGKNVEMENQTISDLFNLQLIKYHGNDMYSYSITDVLHPLETSKVENHQLYSAGQIRSILKKEFYREAINSGLSGDEAMHFVYHYNWIETLLHGAYKNPDHYFAFYQFKTDLYNKLLPYSLDPKPQHESRNMWVMLSNIQNKEYEKPIKFPEIYPAKNTIIEDFSLVEYGVVKEQYSLDSISLENEFFGLDLNSYVYYFYETDIQFYQNDLAQLISNNIDSLYLINGSYIFEINSATEQGITFDSTYLNYPLTAGYKLHNNGKQIVLGTSEYFNGEEFNKTFLNNCLDALYEGNHFVNSEINTKNDEKDFDLTIYPNPFSHSTSFEFNLERPVNVQIEIFDINGKHLELICNNYLNDGTHRFTWSINSSKYQKGIYFARIKIGNELLFRKVVIL